MAVILVKVGNTYNSIVKYFEADDDTDKNGLNTSDIEMGSKIHVIENDKFYILNSSKQWKETSYGGML